MNHLDALPPWAALTVAALVLAGTVLAFLGSLGLLRLKNFYQRVHAPTLGTTLGAFCMLAGSILCFSVLHSRPIFYEILMGVFLTLTTPVSLMLLVRTALHRDQEEASAAAPGHDGRG